MVRTHAQSATFPSEVTEVMGPEEVSALGDEHMLPEGARVGDYVVESVLGRGGGGVVYASRHVLTAVRVAVKVLRPDMAAFPVMIARFAREVDALKKIAHPNIVALLDFGEVSPGRPYYAMELLDGIDLRSSLARDGRLSPVEALELLRPVCEAVEAAHRAGVIHRDLKTNNVLVAEVDGRRVVKLLDFGIAKLLNGESQGQGLTEPGAVIGSAHTIAPEQIRCDPVDERTDVYALGVMLFQLLTGQFPFHADDPHRVALMHLTAPAPRPSLLAPVGPALDNVVLRCMEKQPDLRFSGPRELLVALERAVLEGAPVAGERGSALAVHVQVSAGAAEELDDARVEALLGALDEIEQELVAAAFVLPLRTMSAVLGVRVLARSAPCDPEALAPTICARLKTRAAVHEVAIEARWSVGEVEYRDVEDGLEISSGPLLDIDSWQERSSSARSE